eukprot:502988-Pyramimonas_sp.AAC.1
MSNVYKIITTVWDPSSRRVQTPVTPHSCPISFLGVPGRPSPSRARLASWGVTRSDPVLPGANEGRTQFGRPLGGRCVVYRHA